MQELRSKKFGAYILTHHLAHGGMSEVYLARTEQSEQVYVLKLVECANKEYYLRFRREVGVLYKARHTHIVPLLDFGEEDGWSYYVMPYIKQGTLKERLSAGPLGLEEAGDVLRQIGGALHFLHERGVVHRDIKPANVLLDENGRAWLADLGLVKPLEVGRDITGTGYIIGTPSYMAPELISQPAGVKSDIYALGLVLYEMLTDQHPFGGLTPLETFLKQTIVPPSTLNPLISPALEHVICRALAHSPCARFETALELVAAYHQALFSSPVASTVARSPSRLLCSGQTKGTDIPVSLHKHQRALILILLLILLFLFGMITLFIEVQGTSGRRTQIHPAYGTVISSGSPHARQNGPDYVQRTHFRI